MTPHVDQPLASDLERLAALPWVVECCLGANDEARFVLSFREVPIV